jgi:hypothetical protein
LYQIKRKQKIVTIEGVEYRLRARIHQSFGEDGVLSFFVQ